MHEFFVFNFPKIILKDLICTMIDLMAKLNKQSVLYSPIMANLKLTTFYCKWTILLEGLSVVIRS